MEGYFPHGGGRKVSAVQCGLSRAGRAAPHSALSIPPQVPAPLRHLQGSALKGSHPLAAHSPRTLHAPQQGVKLVEFGLLFFSFALKFLSPDGYSLRYLSHHWHN